MTRRRVLLLFSLLIVLIGLTAKLCLVWSGRPSAITREAAARVHPGVTVDQVEALMCGPARDEANLDWVLDVPDNCPPTAADYRQWISDDVIVGVGFEGGIVVEPVHVWAIRWRPPESMLDRIRRVLGL
jgi:hypothetical protein